MSRGLVTWSEMPYGPVWIRVFGLVLRSTADTRERVAAEDAGRESGCR